MVVALAFTGLAGQAARHPPVAASLRAPAGGSDAVRPLPQQPAAEGRFGACSAIGGALALAGLAARASARSSRARGARARTVVAAKGNTDVPVGIDWSEVSNEWEVDCFSRPVMKDGKKMWELMITDSNAVYRRVAQMKATRVNSVVVQKIMQIFIEESQVKPRVIRFYRKVMKNMLTVALNTVKDSTDYMQNCKIIPSRNCHMLRQWLAYREREVYPAMEGYTPTPKRRSSTSVGSSMVQMQYENLPEKIRFIKYAVSAIPLGALARMKPGQLPGQLCRIPAGYADNALVNGIVILSTRAALLCSVLKPKELNAIRFDIARGELLMDLGIDTTYLIEKVPVEERESCIQFERAKRQLGGLHFVAVHDPMTGGEPNLPIEVDPGGDEGPGPGCITGLWLLTDYTPQDEESG